MVCNVCGQSEATIHLTEILNNQMVEIHLCEGCAEQKGTDFKAHFDFNKLLASLGEFGAEFKAERVSKVVCKECSMSYEEFARTGRLGCANCYQAFEKLLLPLIKRVQRDVHHQGKVPSKTPAAAKNTLELRELQDRLRKSIQSETFEEAARIRDRIQELETKIKKEGKKLK